MLLLNGKVRHCHNDKYAVSCFILVTVAHRAANSCRALSPQRSVTLPAEGLVRSAEPDAVSRRILLPGMTD